MVVKNFYLLGTNPSVTNHIHMVEIDITHDLDACKSAVADSFSIVEPSGVRFQSSKAQGLDDMDTLMDVDQPIAVTVDGHAVRDPPGPQGLPIFGNYYEVYPDHIGNHARLFEKYGPIIKETNMGKTLYLTNDPAVAIHVFQESPFWSKKIGENHPLYGAKSNEDGLFINDTDTESWRVAHKFLPPAFSPKAVRKYTPMTQQTTESTFKVFDQFSEEGEAFDVFAYMFKLTSQVVGKLVLNEDFDHFSSPDAPLHHLVSTLSSFLISVKKVSEKGSWYAHLPFGEPKRLRDLQALFWRGCADALHKAQVKKGSNLPIATAALDAESVADYAARAIDEHGEKMPENVALKALTIIIGAGFGTTSALLSWMLFCLTKYPNVQAKLLQELIDHDVNCDTKWDFDNANNLPYLDKFIKEVQRLYNPAFQPARTALRDQILPGGFQIPKGAALVCAVHSIHNNPAVWDNPGKFDPDRWDRENVRNRPRAAFVPFALGPRSCIGFNFALQEAKTIISTLVYRYEFIRHGDGNVQYDSNSILYSPTNFYAQVVRRTSWPTKSKVSLS